MRQLDSQFLIHKQFEQQALKSPEHVALFEGHESISFADLDSRATKAAAALHIRGIGEGSLVGIYMERSIAWVVGNLAVLKTNAAVVPLPPSYPMERIEEIISHSELSFVIDNASTSLNTTMNVNVLSLVDLCSYNDTSIQAVDGQSDQPAFILCSSGSTNRPKLIVRSHRSFFHRLLWTWEKHPFESDDICCQKAHAATTHCIYELFEPLLRGTPVVIISDEDARNLEEFWITIRSRGISRLLIVPSALQASLNMPGFNPPRLKTLILMGEYVHPDLAARSLDTFSEQTYIYSIYGSTEASSALVCNIRESYRQDEDLVLGEPITADVQLLVLGSDLTPVVAGQIGRLYIAGTALFTEYLKNPTLTESVLVRAPGFPTRLYDTNDEVRLLSDNSLNFVGRVDDTVKIRGFRVELKEVERALMLNADVHQAAVLVRRNQSGAASLIAFVTPSTVDRSQVYKSLKSKLPAYMIPSTVVGLDVFHYTLSGKLDRIRMLQEHALDKTVDIQGRKLSETEVAVSEAWALTLEHRDFTLDCNFFEMGGTSLTVFALISRLRKSFSLERSQLSEQSIYSTPTLQEQSDLIDGLLGNTQVLDPIGGPLLVSLRKGKDGSKAPLFVIPSAGGTPGAYEQIVSSLATTREVIGVRDPYIWGQREATEGFRPWVELYLKAIRGRQPHGPYYLCAYSSAGAFGYEIAHMLVDGGEQVALLALIDPLALDRRGPWRYGWWALRATYSRPSIRWLVKVAGWLRIPAVAGLRAINRVDVDNNYAPSAGEFEDIARYARQNKNHLINFSTLMELNSGISFSLTEEDFLEKHPKQYLGVLLARVKAHMPDVDLETIERIIVQYELQVRTQHAYKLRKYDGIVVLIQPATQYAGLLEALLRAHVANLQVRRLSLGTPSPRTRAICDRFGYLQPHYRCMRDLQFVNGLAKELDSLLE